MLNLLYESNKKMTILYVVRKEKVSFFQVILLSSGVSALH